MIMNLAIFHSACHGHSHNYSVVRIHDFRPNCTKFETKAFPSIAEEFLMLIGFLNGAANNNEKWLETFVAIYLIVAIGKLPK